MEPNKLSPDRATLFEPYDGTVPYLPKDGDPKLLPGWVVGLLESARYQAAATMPGIPHEYTLKKWNDRKQWEEMTELFLDHAVDRKWRRHDRKYLHLNGYQLWFGDSGPKDAWLLNRCPMRYEWDASVRAYDAEAWQYCDRFTTSIEHDKSREAFYREVLGECPGRVLDVGCATGVLADFALRKLLSNDPDLYLGIDPSGAMIELARRKHDHRDFKFMTTRFEDFQSQDRYDTILMLFGTASYIHYVDAAAKAQALLRPGGRAFLMYYEPGKQPKHYRRMHMDMDKQPILLPPDEAKPLDLAKFDGQYRYLEVRA